MAYRPLDDITAGDIAASGISPAEAERLHRRLTEIIGVHGSSGPEAWSNISHGLLNPSLPFAIHQMMYYGSYIGYESDPLAWIPNKDDANLTNIGRILEKRGKEFLGAKYVDPISNFSDFQKFSVSNPEDYWKMLFEEMGISFSVPPLCILREHASYPGGQWLPEASLNAVGNCLSSDGRWDLDDVAIIWRDEGFDDLPVHRLTIRELQEEVRIVANALEMLGLTKGAAVAIDMPMTAKAVIIYLAIVSSGYVVVSIADSFAPIEISTRLQLSNAKAIFTQVQRV